ncbi:unnamed protein product [Rotaria socialis]
MSSKPEEEEEKQEKKEDKQETAALEEPALPPEVDAFFKGKNKYKHPYGDWKPVVKVDSSKRKTLSDQLDLPADNWHLPENQPAPNGKYLEYHQVYHQKQAKESYSRNEKRPQIDNCVARLANMIR